MILFLLSIISWAAENHSLCQTISENPCAYSESWKHLSGEKSWILMPKLPGDLSTSEKDQAIQFLVSQIKTKSFSESLLKKIGSIEPTEAANCISNKFFAYTFGFKVDAFPCSLSLQKLIDHHFDNPNEFTQNDFKVMKSFVTEVRTAVSGEKEKILEAFLEKIKLELINLLRKKKAPSKFTRLVRSIQYTKDSCIRSKGRDKMSFEAGKEVYVCQGFVWQPTTLVNAIWTLSHETAHSLSACDLSRRDLLSFDRNTKKIDLMIAKHPLRGFYEEALSEIVDAKDFHKADNVCDYVNLDEAFADRLAAELAIPILAKAFAAQPTSLEEIRLHVLSMGTRICRIKDYPDLEKIPAYFRHPLGKPRMEFFLKQSWVEKQLSCGEDSR